MEGIAMGFYRVAEWVTRFAYVNLLWVAFTVFGLILFGFLPSTVAMFAVVRKWTMGEKDVPIFTLFWKTYKKEFIKANLLGYILLIIGYVLSMEFRVLQTQTAMPYFIASFGVIAQFILYAVVLMYFFPIFVHFNLTAKQYFKWPFIIGIGHPILTVFLVVVVGLIHYVAFNTIPGILFFFGGSVTAFILMWGASLTFSKYEKAEA